MRGGLLYSALSDVRRSLSGHQSGGLWPAAFLSLSLSSSALNTHSQLSLVAPEVSPLSSPEICLSSPSPHLHSVSRAFPTAQQKVRELRCWNEILKYGTNVFQPVWFNMIPTTLSSNPNLLYPARHPICLLSWVFLMTLLSKNIKSNTSSPVNGPSISVYLLTVTPCCRPSYTYTTK